MIKEKFAIMVCLDFRLYSFLQDEKISNMVLTYAGIVPDYGAGLQRVLYRKLEIDR